MRRSNAAVKVGLQSGWLVELSLVVEVANKGWNGWGCKCEGLGVEVVGSMMDGDFVEDEG